METPPPIRVVRIIARLNVGGPARHVAWLTAGLQDDRFRSTLVTGTLAPGEQDLADFARGMGVEPVIIGEMSRSISWRDAVVVWKLFRLLRRLKPDIIHTHTAKAGAAGRTAGLLYRLTSRRRVPFVHTFHGHVFHGYYGPLVTRMFLTVERILARFTDAIIVLSPRQREEINVHYRIGSSTQFRVVPLGLDLKTDPSAPTRDSFRRELGIAPNAFVAAIVGRLTGVKDHAFFLDAVAAAGRNDVVFVVIGDGDLRPTLEAQAKSLGLEGRVRFIGNRNDPERFYRGIDLLVLTSRNEGTPLTILEAFANEVPVMSTAVGGVPDLLAEDRGLLFEHGDIAGFGKALSVAVSDRGRTRAMAARGLAYVREHYSRERLIRDIRGLYEDLLRRATR